MRRGAGRLIDLKNWERREHYQLFRKYAQPFFSVTVDVDVARVWHGCRNDGAPSFFSDCVVSDVTSGERNRTVPAETPAPRCLAPRARGCRSDHPAAR